MIVQQKWVPGCIIRTEGIPVTVAISLQQFRLGAHVVRVETDCRCKRSQRTGRRCNGGQEEDSSDEFHIVGWLTNRRHYTSTKGVSECRGMPALQPLACAFQQQKSPVEVSRKLARFMQHNRSQWCNSAMSAGYEDWVGLPQGGSACLQCTVELLLEVTTAFSVQGSLGTCLMLVCFIYSGWCSVVWTP